MSTTEQPDAARIEANAAAIAVNPVYENERLAQLTVMKRFHGSALL